MLNRRSIAAFAFCSFAGVSLFFAQSTAPVSEGDLAGLIRTVNTAEMTWKSTHGAYADLRDLANDKLVADRMVQLKIKDRDTATMQDYQLRILLASDGQKYMAALTKENGCSLAMFSTESAIIYQATAFGCK